MAKRIVFLLGSANISGGTYVVFQHAHHLKSLGYDVTIALVYMTIAELNQLKLTKCWHPALLDLSFIHISEASQHQFDLGIFTWWATLFYADKIQAAQFLYFIQSIESRFYLENETFMRDLVDRTYQLGLPVITEAQWIQAYLQKHYQSRCQLVRNGILKSVYNTEGEVLAAKSTQQLRILVEGPVDVHFKNVPRTIALCQQANVGEIWLLTSTAIASYPGVTRIFSQVPIADVPAIYRSCDVLVKLSYVEGMFGPPLEIFHCGGTAIVYAVTGHDEYIAHDVNALVAKKDDEASVVQYLKCLHEDRNLLARLCAGAKATAEQWSDWSQSSHMFAQALEKISHRPLTKDGLMKAHKKHLTEVIDVVMIHADVPMKKSVEARPEYNSGEYTLSIPLAVGQTELGINFGKRYRSLLVLDFKIRDEIGSIVNASFQLSMNQMQQNPDQSFTCLQNASMLVAILTVESANCFVEVKFKPLQVMRVSEKAVV